MKFRIFGHSDDNVEIDGDLVGSIGVWDAAVTIRIGDEERQTIVTFTFNDRTLAPWWATVARRPGVPMWPVEITSGETYTESGVVVNVEVPDGTEVVWRVEGETEWEVPS